ncbi:type II toxin-antitoxin system VapC family toxin [Rhodoferax sp. 4810]|nr:type II toxin-antitoxin system VapC family toxin [Rhodoferax jenense]
MKHVVLDANVCLNWFLDTPAKDQTQYAWAFADFIKNESVTLHVPIHFDLEVTGPLLKNLRAKTPGLTEKKFNAYLDEMDALPLNFHELGMGFRKMADMARAYNLSIYDTPYFNLARAFDFELATLDAGLRTAAQAWGVHIWQP